MGTIAKVCESVLEQNNIDGNVLVLTGDDGMKNKVFIMHSFGQEDAEENAARAADEGTKPLPNLLIMPATPAVNCGVSSKDCHRSYRIGIPPSMYTLVQELGHVDRNTSVGIGDNRYKEINPSQVLFTQDKQTRSFVGSQYACQTALQCFNDALRTSGSDLLVYYSWLVDAGLVITMNCPTLLPRPPAPIFQCELRTLSVEPLSISKINPQHEQWIHRPCSWIGALVNCTIFKSKLFIRLLFFENRWCMLVQKLGPESWLYPSLLDLSCRE